MLSDISILLILMVFLHKKTVIFSKDNINYNPQHAIGTVVEKNSTVQGRFFYETVIFKNQESYKVYFNNPHMSEGKKYKITYLPKSKIVLEAIKIKNSGK